MSLAHETCFLRSCRCPAACKDYGYCAERNSCATPSEQEVTQIQRAVFEQRMCAFERAVQQAAQQRRLA